MKGNRSILKKRLIIFHILSGVIALLSIFIFIQTEKYSGVYKSFLLCYIISGAVILTIFFKILPLFQRLYFELLFLLPLGVMAFWLFTRFFEYVFFG
jgi:hypothetical protein